MFVSSHILSDLAEYCSHIAIMARGRIMRYGTVAEISHDEAVVSLYTVRLAGAVTQETADAVLTIDGVTTVRAHEERLEIEAPAGKAAAARLLADLVAAGIPVCGFAVEGGGLEQAYLRSGIAQVD